MAYGRLLNRVLVLISFIFIFGCSAKTPVPPVGETVGYHPLPQREARRFSVHLSTRLQGLSSWEEMRPGLEDSLKYIRHRPQDAVAVHQPGLTLTWAQLGDSVQELLEILPDLDHDPRLVAERFKWLKLGPKTLLTGYYEPWLQASMERKGRYQYPLYGVPCDLKSVNLGEFHHRWKGQTLVYRMTEDGIRPYYDREAIDGEKVLAGAGTEIAWAKNPVDVFFLQIQGSGRLDLEDGTVKHILYGGKNGHKYVSLGRLLIENGCIPKEEMSMQRIREYLESHPYTADKLMYQNPSYVFFKLSDEGPYGAMNSILTPRVSVAVDRRMIPLGSVLALKTALMDYDKGKSEQFMSLVLAQDTGGAIQGTRMDFFCGSGEEAELLAGHLQEDSEVFMLVSKRVLAALPGED